MPAPSPKLTKKTPNTTPVSDLPSGDGSSYLRCPLNVCINPPESVYSPPCWPTSSAWKWPLCSPPWCSNLWRPHCVPFQTVARGYVWPRHIIPLQTPEPLLFHWALVKVLHVGVAQRRLFTPSSSKKGLLSPPLWIMGMNNKQPPVYPSLLKRQRCPSSEGNCVFF